VTALTTSKCEAALKCIAEIFSVVDTDTNALACTADGAGVTDATVGSPAEVVVRTVDFDGQPITDSGVDVGVTLIRCDGGGGGDGDNVDGRGDGGASRVVASVRNAGDGSYVCSYTATTAEGAWQLEVCVAGKQIQGSPFAVQVSVGVRFSSDDPAEWKNLIAKAHCAGRFEVTGDTIKRMTSSDIEQLNSELDSHFAIQRREQGLREPVPFVPYSDEEDDEEEMADDFFHGM
jgi:hypothetical protein